MIIFLIIFFSEWRLKRLSVLLDDKQLAYPYDPINCGNCVELEFLVSECCLELSVVNM